MGYGLADSRQTNMAFDVYLDLTEGMETTISSMIL